MYTTSTRDLTFTSVLKKNQKSYLPYEANVDTLLHQQNCYSHQSIQPNSLSYLFDFPQRKFLQVSDAMKHLIGHEFQDSFHGEVDKIIPLIHKDDFKIFNEKIFPFTLLFLQKHPISEHSKYIFSHNYRIKNPTGDWLHFHQKTSYITTSSTGLPILSFGLLIDISDFKNDSKIIYRINKAEHDRSAYSKPLMSHFFYPDAGDCILSTQERRVLTLISEGLNSREIAERLHLSENTIINHRRNMQTKTNTKNVAQLITYACKHQIL